LKPVYDGLQKIKFEKPRAKYKAEHEAELKQFYAARRKLTGEFPDGKVDMKKLTEEWCCTIKVDIENSKGQYIEKDKQEATKDGSESTKIQHGI
jgi:hypothetical protein